MNELMQVLKQDKKGVKNSLLFFSKSVDIRERFNWKDDIL